MRFKTEIDRAYRELGFIPINGQDVAIDRILTAFFINKKKNVILSADTGTGKSIIGAVVAKIFQYRFGAPSSFILMHTNSLVEQYQKTFENSHPGEFFQIRGASNYRCTAAIELTNDITLNAESCMKTKLSLEMQNTHCNDCEYMESRKLSRITANLITNYSYYFISKMWSNHLEDRHISIFDEAHTINEIFSNHNAIFFSVDRLESYLKECSEKWPIRAKASIDSINLVRNDLKNKKINDNNYKKYLTILLKAYKEIAQIAKSELDKGGIEDSIKSEKTFRKYFGLGCKLGDFFTYNYDHVFDLNEESTEVSVKPVFIGKMSPVLMSEYNLFMSATVSDTFMIQTLELEKDNLEFIKLAPVYDPNNKEVILCSLGNMNYEFLKDYKNVNIIKNTCNVIVSDHKNEKGIILTPSFKLAEELAKSIKTHKVFLHTSNIKLDNLIKNFKAYGKDAVLISPSIFEGLDFSDDDSRFQIIVKAPFPSLGEKRIKYIATKYPQIYRLMTLKKIVQGIGRSTRNENDWARTYILDGNAIQLFTSSLNVWKDQFNIVRLK